MSIIRPQRRRDGIDRRRKSLGKSWQKRRCLTPLAAQHPSQFPAQVTQPSFSIRANPYHRYPQAPGEPLNVNVYAPGIRHVRHIQRDNCRQAELEDL